MTSSALRPRFYDVQDLTAPDCEAEYAEEGILYFTCGSREEFVESIGRLGPVAFHRDSEADGVTVVEHKPSQAGMKGYRAMTNGPLALHTDGSGDDDPPSAVALWFEQAGGTGGETLLVDACALYRQLERDHPDTAAVLSTAGSAIFISGSNLVKASIFELQPDGEVRVRLRSDGLGYFTLDSSRHLQVFQQYAMHNVQVLSMQEGQGYLIDNRRYLHGRREFSGARRVLRLLLNAVHGAGDASAGAS